MVDLNQAVWVDRGEVLAVVALSALVWVAILRRRVREQTAIIRARLEKEAEEALRRSQERFETVFRTSPLAISITEIAGGRILDVNEQCAHVFGYTRPEMVGRTTLEMRLWADAAEREHVVDELRAGRVVRDREVRMRCQSGEIRYARLSMNRLELSGAEAAFVTVATDITEQKNLEERLRQSQKMEAVGRLAGGIAHDFNNLLGVISGYGELLQRELGPGHPGLARVEEIRKASDRAAALTRQLLAFGRKQVLEPKVLDLNDVVADTVQMLRRLIGEDVQLVTALTADLGSVLADPGQIQQLIVNLAVNSRDAMSAGGTLLLETGNVTLDAAYARSRPEAHEGAHVMLAVTDTGHGMDAETLSHMFEPFFTTREQGKGTGLGLATVHGIVRQSGGHVTVSSQPGRGTTFKVYLPRFTDEHQTVAAPARAAMGPSGTETILLVEDEPSLREMIQEILESAGYSVLGGLSAEEALAAAGAHPGCIPLVLSDVIMPGMSGRQMVDTLHLSRPDARVLFMSGYTDDAISQEGILENGMHFLPKPFTTAELLSKVREVLSGPSPRHDTPPTGKSDPPPPA